MGHPVKYGCKPLKGPVKKPYIPYKCKQVSECEGRIMSSNPPCCKEPYTGYAKLHDPEHDFHKPDPCPFNIKPDAEQLKTRPVEHRSPAFFLRKSLDYPNSIKGLTQN